MVYNLWKTLKDDSLNFFTELIFQNFSPDSMGISVLDKNLSVLIWMYVFEVLFMIEMGSKVTLIVLYPLHMNLLVRIRYHLFGWMEINRVRSRDLEHTFDFAHLDFKHDPMMTESWDSKWPEK